MLRKYKRLIEKYSIKPKEIPFYLYLLRYQFERIQKTYYKGHDGACIRLKFPTILLLGPLGIGKSEQVRLFGMMYAHMRGKKFVDFSELGGSNGYKLGAIRKILSNPDEYFIFVDIRLSTVEPYDLQGVIRDVNLSDGSGRLSEYVPFIWVYLLSACEGILFLDELTQVSRDDVASAAYQILLDKQIGLQKLNRDVIVIAAGNLPWNTELARSLDSGIVNRCIVFYVDEPPPDDIYEYISAKHEKRFLRSIEEYVLSRLARTISDGPGYIHDVRSILSLLSELKQSYNPKRTGLLNFPTPRTMEWFVYFSVGITDIDVLKRIAFGLLGPVSVELCKYLDPIYRKSMKDREMKIMELLDRIIGDPEGHIDVLSDIKRMGELFDFLSTKLNYLHRKDREAYGDLLRKTVDVVLAIFDFGEYIDILAMLVRKLSDGVFRDLITELGKRGTSGNMLIERLIWSRRKG